MTDYATERKKYERALELQTQAAVDACEKALKAIGVYVSDRMHERLFDTLSDTMR